MMILRTGKMTKAMSFESGISLVEVLLSVVILSVGVVVICHPMVRALDQIDTIDSRLEASAIADEEIDKIQISSQHSQQLSALDRAGIRTGQKRAYQYQWDAFPLVKDRHLYEAVMTVGWKVMGRDKQHSRHFYVLIPNETV